MNLLHKLFEWSEDSLHEINNENFEIIVAENFKRKMTLK